MFFYVTAVATTFIISIHIILEINSFKHDLDNNSAESLSIRRSIQNVYQFQPYKLKNLKHVKTYYTLLILL